jgi:Domain of unknown function (DUF4124)
MLMFGGARILGVLLGAGLLTAQAQEIYSCVDSKGRRLTSDRPIAECIDREQKLLNPSGTVKKQVGPTLTAKERADQEAQERREEEDRALVAENKRRDRALVTRYPSQAVHDNERAEALAQIAAVRKAAINRVNELAHERESIEKEKEFYKKSPDKVPTTLRRQLEDNAHSKDVQLRFITEQEAEMKRVNARFDEELARLKLLWAQRTPAPAAASSK